MCGDKVDLEYLLAVRVAKIWAIQTAHGVVGLGLNRTHLGWQPALNLPGYHWVTQSIDVESSPIRTCLGVLLVSGDISIDVYRESISTANIIDERYVQGLCEIKPLRNELSGIGKINILKKKVEAILAEY
jgi:hypothetical protein